MTSLPSPTLYSNSTTQANEPRKPPRNPPAELRRHQRRRSQIPTASSDGRPPLLPETWRQEAVSGLRRPVRRRARHPGGRAALLGFLIFPFELATALPGNGGYVVWADRAFGPFVDTLVGSWKFLSGVINSAAYPVLCADYLARVAPPLAAGLPRITTIVGFTTLLSFLNYTAVALCATSLLPFFIMVGVAMSRLRPRRSLEIGGRVTGPEREAKAALDRRGRRRGRDRERPGGGRGGETKRLSPPRYSNGG